MRLSLKTFEIGKENTVEAYYDSLSFSKISRWEAGYNTLAEGKIILHMYLYIKN
jgi:hypothetical protein